MKTTKKICYIACFIALFIILDKISILLPVFNVRITMRNLPLYVGAYIYGPAIGALIGFVGMIVSQFNYAFDLMWIVFLIPQTTVGYVTGFLSKYKIFNCETNIKKFSIIMVLLNLLLSTINTLCIFIRYIYYGSNIIAASITSLTEIPLRMVNSVVTGLAYCVLLPTIVKLLKK